MLVLTQEPRKITANPRDCNAQHNTLTARVLRPMPARPPARPAHLQHFLHVFLLLLGVREPVLRLPQLRRRRALLLCGMQMQGLMTTTSTYFYFHFCRYEYDL
jgi:hypothetical protein